MRLKIINLVCVLFSLVMFHSCSQEGKYKDYTLFIRNSSNEVLQVETYRNNYLVNLVYIQSSDNGLDCNLIDVRLLSYDLCDNIDSIKFIFPNGKGYVCSIGGDESLCFGNEITPWTLNDKFINTSGNIYEFTITQDDFENAYELP